MSNTDQYDNWRRHWPVVAGTFIMAFFAWGAIFYAHGVFKVGLEQSHGWPGLMLSLAQSWFWMAAAVAALLVGRAIDRFGPQKLALYGTCAAAVAIAAIGWIQQPWHVFAVYTLLATAYSPLANLGISAALAPLFQRHFATALSIALTGASAGGAVITPLLIAAMAQYDFATACLALAGVTAVILLPVSFVLPKRPKPSSDRPVTAANHAFRTITFWAIAVTAGLSLFSQVGFLFHQISILSPVVGVEGAGYAVSVTVLSGAAGRFVLGWAALRWPVHWVASATYVLQAMGMVMLIFSTDTDGLYLSAAVIGFAVGAIVMLPGMLTRSVFGTEHFGRIFGAVNMAMFTGAPLGPGVGGIVAQIWGYTAAIALFALTLLLAAVTVLRAKATSS